MRTRSRGIRLGTLALSLLLPCLVGTAASVRAGDVPEDMQVTYDSARSLLAQGKRADLTKAFSILDTRKDEAGTSVDFWELYARLWLMLDKGADQLWSTVLDPRQALDPTCTTFDLVHARLAHDAKAQRKWIDAALKRAPKDLNARLAKGRFLLAHDATDEGADLLDGLLEDHPGCVPALLALAGLSLHEGFAKEALQYVDRGLAKRETAALWDMKSRCFERLAQNADRKGNLAKSLDAAARALGIDPGEDYIKHYNDLLQQTGDDATATKALKEHFLRTKQPMLGALLGQTAMRAGDYEAAALGLEAGSQTDLATVKALATCYARLGRAEDAMRVARKILALDSSGRIFVARLQLWLGDTAGVAVTLHGLADADARRLQALALAWDGKVDAVKGLVGKEARSGARDAEDLLTAWFQARVFDRMGPELAVPLRKKLLEARFAAGHEVLAQAADHDADLGKVKTAGWPRRALTYFRAPCGALYKPSEDWTGRSFVSDSEKQTMTVYYTVSGEAACGDSKQQFEVRFNGITRKSSGNGLIELFGDDASSKLVDFAPAEAAFGDACAAWLDGDATQAESACAKALGIEPAFSRVKVYRSVARALAATGDRRADAKDAAAAVALYKDDFALRRLVLLLRAWVGDTDLAAEIKALAKREAQIGERNIANL
jgi:tetratricopeptide (TPR) repeat protein